MPSSVAIASSAAPDDVETHLADQTVHQWLLSTPRGAYTTLLVKQGRLLADWLVHLQRLIKSLKALHDTLVGFYARLFAWAEPRGGLTEGDLQALLLPTVRACLDQYIQHIAGAPELDCMLVLVLPPADAPLHGFAVHACAAPYTAAERSAVHAVVLGPPRQVPIGKDTGWVRQRQCLEAMRPPDAGEVLLCSSDGRLLEGLVTNLFILAQAEQLAAEDDREQRDGARSVAGLAGAESQPGCSSHLGGNAITTQNVSSSSSSSRVVLWTAGMGDGVVWGTLRVRVLQACQALGIPVREEAPPMAARHTWREAFLANSLRGVQPLRQITCDPRNDWGHPAWELQLAPAPGPLTAVIQDAVVAATPLTDITCM